MTQNELGMMRINNLCDHIKEQAEKQQFLNCLSSCQELLGILLSKLNRKLKGETP